MTNGQLSEQITYRETNRIVSIIDRADLIREAVRFWLASNSHLSSEEKNDLGVAQ